MFLFYFYPLFLGPMVGHTFMLFFLNGSHFLLRVNHGFEKEGQADASLIRHICLSYKCWRSTCFFLLSFFSFLYRLRYPLCPY